MKICYRGQQVFLKSAESQRKNKTAKRRSKFSQGTRYLPLTFETDISIWLNEESVNLEFVMFKIIHDFSALIIALFFLQEYILIVGESNSFEELKVS